MTREEAIEHIKDIICENNTVKHSDIVVFEEEKEALRMAIQALSQEPCDDAISQNQSNACSILDDECPYPHKHCWGCSLNYQYELAKLKLEKKDRLPQRKSNADEKHIENTLERQSGKWIDYSDEGYVECPFCGHATNCKDDIDELHYCFYCGARMVEPQESEE